MVPILSRANEPTGEFRKTLADELLPDYDYDLSVTIADENGKDMIIPVWRFIEMYLRIKDKSGNFCVFEINEAQCQFYIEICKQKRDSQPIRADILKARQLGFSTFIAAIIFTLTILVPNQTAAIIADTADHATNLFRKYKFYYVNLPEFFKSKLPIVASNAKELIINYGNGQESKVRVLVQGENAGRSDTCQYLHLSEVAFWQNIEETTTSVLQTVDDNNLNSIIAYETTANGSNYYKEIWDADCSGDTGYKALFFPWYQDKRNIAPYYETSLFDWEIRNKEKYGLTNEQVAWYRNQYKKMRGNLDKLRQEMPSSPTEAFIVSGNCVFNMELVLKRKEELMNKKKLIKQGLFSYVRKVSIDGNQILVDEIRWVDDETGSVYIYEEPKEGYPYVLNLDPGAGGEDYYVVQVIDNTNGHQVATYRKHKCDADDAGYQMYCLLKYYTTSIDALASAETNTSTGMYILKLLFKCGWRNIYQDQNYVALSGKFTDKFGYRTESNNRHAMIEMAVEQFRDDPKSISDYNTICEMETFVNVRNENTRTEKQQAANGSHDDCVMSYCGALFVRHAQKFIPDTIIEEQNEMVFDPFNIIKEDQDQIEGDYEWE